MKILLLLLLGTGVATKSVACECATYSLVELDRRSYQSSDIVIIGEVLVSGSSYKVKIVEVLKGELDSSVINGTVIGKDGVVNNCTSFPRVQGRYLLYLKKIDKDNKHYYLYNQCDGTRLMNLKYLPVSLLSKETKEELKVKTANWIGYLRQKR